MTKKELIRALAKYKDNAEIRFSNKKNGRRYLYLADGVQDIWENGDCALIYCDN